MFNFLAKTLVTACGSWSFSIYDMFSFAEWNIFIASFKVFVNSIANNRIIEFVESIFIHAYFMVPFFIFEKISSSLVACSILSILPDAMKEVHCFNGNDANFRRHFLELFMVFFPSL